MFEFEIGSAVRIRSAIRISSAQTTHHKLDSNFAETEFIDNLLFYDIPVNENILFRIIKLDWKLEMILLTLLILFTFNVLCVISLDINFEIDEAVIPDIKKLTNTLPKEYTSETNNGLVKSPSETSMTPFSYSHAVSGSVKSFSAMSGLSASSKSSPGSSASSPSGPSMTPFSYSQVLSGSMRVSSSSSIKSFSLSMTILSSMSGPSMTPFS